MERKCHRYNQGCAENDRGYENYRQGLGAGEIYLLSQNIPENTSATATFNERAAGRGIGKLEQPEGEPDRAESGTADVIDNGQHWEVLLFREAGG